jgi:hypothetical protein
MKREKERSVSERYDILTTAEMEEAERLCALRCGHRQDLS